MISKQVVLSGLRQILIFAGGFVVAKGWIDTSTLEAVVAAVLTLVTAGWGLVSKHNDTQDKAALVEQVVNAGQTPVVEVK